MSIEIKIDALRSSSNNINARIVQLDGLNARLNSLIGQIDSSWEGKASDKYVKKLRAHEKQARKMVDLLKVFKSYVDLAVNIFEDFDIKHAGAINSSW